VLKNGLTLLFLWALANMANARSVTIKTTMIVDGKGQVLRNNEIVVENGKIARNRTWGRRFTTLMRPKNHKVRAFRFQGCYQESLRLSRIGPAPRAKACYVTGSPSLRAR
jgi:hypothetical protein